MKIKEMQPGWHLLLLCAVFLLLMPIVFAVSNSFKTMQDAFNTVFQIIPARPTVQNYIHVFSKLPFLRITMNTFLIAATVTIFITRSAMAAVLQLYRGFVATRRITGKTHTAHSMTPSTARTKTGRATTFSLCRS